MTLKSVIHVSMRTPGIALLVVAIWAVLPWASHAQSCWEPAKPHCNPSLSASVCQSNLLSYLERDRAYRECRQTEEGRKRSILY